MKARIYIFIVLFSLMAVLGKAQVIENPHVGFQSHPTIHVISVDISAKYTRVLMQATNYAEGGDNLCIDKNTRLTTSTGKKLNLISSENLPTCPANYRFTRKEEVLQFTLVFPALDAGTMYIDIEEVCDAYCLNYKGIVVDKRLNELINKGYAAYQLKQDEQALLYFKEALNAAPNYPYGILYFNIIKISAELNKWDEVRNWYKLLTQSNVNDKEFYKEKVRSDYLSD